MNAHLPSLNAELNIKPGRGNPLVSIGFPVYNGSRFMRHALDSLLTQTYEDIEIVIADNASIDETQEICTAYAKKDSRIRYFRNEENMGAVWNYNHVFELSSAKFFMWASCDDYWDPIYIETCLQSITASSKMILAGTICQGVHPDTNRIRLIDAGITTVGMRPFNRFKHYKSIIHRGKHIGGIFYGLYRSSELKKVMPIKKLIAADHFIIADLALRGEFVTVPKALFFKRWGGASRNFKKSAAAIGIKNRFLIAVPYLIREFFMQMIIYRSANLSWKNKVRLAVWSLGNYFRVNLLKMTYIEIKIFVKRFIGTYCG
ncbi:MAG: glycosyltransferase family 2 protein [Thermodesulfobacteriota bacterium]|nr:glycosyltransferase family 2 protein [Thermodesulfobacteriota bacterium]